MTPNRSQINLPRAAAGFSLIELMISVVIGLLGVLVIFQILSVWDTNKRTATAGGDAQISGNLAIFNLDRDLKLAGFGLGTVLPNIIGCNVEAIDATGTAANFNLSPIVITQGAGAAATTGAGGAPDSITVLYGNSSYFVDAQRFSSATSTTKKSRGRSGLMRGDLVVVANSPVTPPADCALVEVTDDSNTDRLTFGHAQMNYVRFSETATVASRFNPAGGTTFPFSAGYLYNLGPRPSRNVWQIRTGAAGGVLAWSNTIFATPLQDVAEGIVDLQAQYGLANVIPTTPPDWSSTAPAAADWPRLRAVRVAILSRSQQFEKEAVTTTAPTYFDNTFSFNMTNVFGAASSNTVGDPNNWRHYRYRVYEKVVPMRNVTWGGQS
jgi:type IV pilus assembly protein PilW